MRILHLYAGNLYGGIETLLATLARCRHLCPQMEPSFGLCFDGRIKDELKETGVQVFDLPPVRFSRPWTVFKARESLKQLLTKNRFDVVATHANWPHAVFAPAVRACGIPLVNFVHDAFRSIGWLDRLASRTPPDLAIANSHYSAQYVPRVFGSVPVEVVYLPVEYKEVKLSEQQRNEIRHSLNTASDSTVIIQVSRMQEIKGVDITIAALAELKENPQWTAWIVGGAQRPSEVAYEERLKQIANENGVFDRIRFLGQRNDVSVLLPAADIFCQPNKNPDAFGIVFIEALYSGLPVVTSNIGGGAEIVVGNVGCLIEPVDSTQVANAIRKLFDPVNKPAADVCRCRSAALCDPKAQISTYRQKLYSLCN